MLDTGDTALAILSDAELDLIGAGVGRFLNLNLSGLVNLNIATVVQTGVNIAVLNGSVTQGIAQFTSTMQYIHFG